MNWPNWCLRIEATRGFPMVRIHTHMYMYIYIRLSAAQIHPCFLAAETPPSNFFCTYPALPLLSLKFDSSVPSRFLCGVCGFVHHHTSFSSFFSSFVAASQTPTFPHVDTHFNVSLPVSRAFRKKEERKKEGLEEDGVDV